VLVMAPFAVIPHEMISKEEEGYTTCDDKLVMPDEPL